MNFKKISFFLLILFCFFILPKIINAVSGDCYWGSNGEKFCGTTYIPHPTGGGSGYFTDCGGCGSNMECHDNWRCEGSASSFGVCCKKEQCKTNWYCSSFGSCINNRQTRTCLDLNGCNVNTDKPPESQPCSGGGCTPSCAGKVCGLNGCGGFCAPNNCSDSGKVCTVSGQCCKPNCSSNSCGKSDGCGGTCEFCEDSSAKCIVNPDKPTERKCCVAVCPEDRQAGASDGCGGICPPPKDKLGITDIILQPEYVTETAKKKFFIPKMGDLNPYDKIDCIYKSGAGDNIVGDIQADLVVVDGGDKYNVISGTLSYSVDRNIYVWRISDDWGRKVIDLINNYRLGENRKLKCVANVNRNGSHQESPSNPYKVSMCTHVWGGELAPRTADANVYKLVVSGGKDVGEKTYDFADDSLRQNTMVSAPFTDFKYQFEYYVDIKEIDDSDLKEAPEYHDDLLDLRKISECKNIVNGSGEKSILDIFLTKKNEFLFPVFRALYIDEFSPTIYFGYSTYQMHLNGLTHEIGHYFGLGDEYVVPRLAAIEAKSLPPLPPAYSKFNNCSEVSSCSPFKSKFLSYGDGCFKGCGYNSFYRSTGGSIMNNSYENGWFNRVSCATILAKMLPFTTESAAYKYCSGFKYIQK